MNVGTCVQFVRRFFVVVALAATSAAYGAISAGEFDEAGDAYSVTQAIPLGPRGSKTFSHDYEFTVIGEFDLRLFGSQQGLTDNTLSISGSALPAPIVITSSPYEIVAHLVTGTYILTIAGSRKNASAEYNFNIQSVPLPAAVWLFGSVLLALAAIGRKRNLGKAALSVRGGLVAETV